MKLGTKTWLCKIPEYFPHTNAHHCVAHLLYKNLIGVWTMAKPAGIKIKLLSTADTGYFYVKRLTPFETFLAYILLALLQYTLSHPPSITPLFNKSGLCYWLHGCCWLGETSYVVKSVIALAGSVNVVFFCSRKIIEPDIKQSRIYKPVCTNSN